MGALRSSAMVPALFKADRIIEDDESTGPRDDFIGILSSDTKGISGGIGSTSS